MLSTFTQAASNTITFNGTVSDTTCTATIDGGVTSIEMGTTSVADLKANTFGAAKNFFHFHSLTVLLLKKGGNAVARITFGGEADAANSDYFKKTEGHEFCCFRRCGRHFFDNEGNLLKKITKKVPMSIFHPGQQLFPLL